MWEKGYRELEENRRIRENLSLLRSEAKDPKVKRALAERVGDGALLASFLQSDEPKVRKNAALLIGDLGIRQAVDALFLAYQAETTLFVRSAYLDALAGLDASAYISELKMRRDFLVAYEAAEEEKKHIAAELRGLETIIAGVEGIGRHTFVGLSDRHELLLVNTKELRQATLAEAKRLSSDIAETASLHPLGVSVNTRELRAVAELRTYRELLFPIHIERRYAREKDPAQLAGAIWHSDMPALLAELYRETTPFYYRLELRGGMEPAEKSRFARQFAAELTHVSGHGYINSTSDYELEIRLIAKKEGGYAVFLRLPGLDSERFSYRKHAIAGSMHPSVAAAVIELARPYLKEGAQILDPFCGVGTLLIERDMAVCAREKYGIDSFGEAVRMAREHAVAAGQKINFINRDYFTFRHEYLFDEIVTDMPVRGKGSKEELDSLYGRFFERSGELLVPGAVIVMCSGEEGFVKKYLRLHADYRLLTEHCLRGKDQFHLFVIRYKG